MNEETKKVDTEVKMQNANPETTQQPAVKAEPEKQVDLQEAIKQAVEAANRAAERKEKTVVNSTLAQQNLDPHDEIVKQALEEYIKNRPTPEKLLEQEKQARIEAENKAKALENRVTALNKGIPADKADKYLKMAAGLVDESKTLESALDEILADMPVNKAPAMAEGTGTKEMPKNDMLMSILTGKK